MVHLMAVILTVLLVVRFQKQTWVQSFSLCPPPTSWWSKWTMFNMNSSLSQRRSRYKTHITICCTVGGGKTVSFTQWFFNYGILIISEPVADVIKQMVFLKTNLKTRISVMCVCSAGTDSRDCEDHQRHHCTQPPVQVSPDTYLVCYLSQSVVTMFYHPIFVSVFIYIIQLAVHM